MADFERITRAYYAGWFGLTDFPNEDCAVYCAARNEAPRGYADRFDVFALALREGGTYIAYGDRARDGIKTLDRTLPVPDALEAAFGKTPEHGVKFAFQALPEPGKRARALEMRDESAWRTFFGTLNPRAEGDWIAEYFAEIVSSGLAYGVFADGALVCATDLPSMPHMEDVTREVGINTLPEHRQKGYARDTCAETVRAMVARGICPAWSARADNAASRALARSVGFREYADAYMLTL